MTKSQVNCSEYNIKIKGVTCKFMIDEKLCQKQIYFILGYYVNLRP